MFTAHVITSWGYEPVQQFCVLIDHISKKYMMQYHQAVYVQLKSQWSLIRIQYYVYVCAAERLLSIFTLLSAPIGKIVRV